MIRRNREISIFSMSTLDVIFGALGAFMIMMLTLFPLQQRLEEAQDRQRQILVIAQWSEPGLDVDLWVKEPDGEYMGPKPETMGGAAVFQTRDIVGAGFETASLVNASSGIYEVIYRLHAIAGGRPPAVVHGWVIARAPGADGGLGSYQISDLGSRSLDRAGQQLTHARIDVTLDSTATALLKSVEVQ